MNFDTRDSRVAPVLPERLPTMPSAAVGVLELAACGEPTAPDLYRIVSVDPASVLAVLTAAARGKRRPHCPSLRVAIERLGVTAALRACLNFRLADRRTATELDCIGQWRRAVLITAYARAIARRLRRHDADQIETAAALRCASALRSGVRREQEPDVWLAHHGVDAALCALVHASRAREPVDAAACIALAEHMSEVWLQQDWERNLARTRALAMHLFGAVPDLCGWVFGVLGPQARDLEMLLQIRRLSHRRIVALTAQAHALLLRWQTPAAAPAD